ncbi:MlaD family protein [Patulibacter defluvii]|uniref:MlaD family protein n=1 Tax=Patulibacter defluvii TaxID=3095358 RepID=UPI002A75CA6B|nr:MlaD family protein [Patulibacter sp. DM4]
MKQRRLAGKSLALIALLIGAGAILAYFYTTAGGRLPFSENPYRVTAVMTDSQQLLKHADVRAAGVKIGSVGQIDNVGDRIHVQLELDRKYAPLYRDAKVQVRQKTLVGENYVEVTPGSPRSGAPLADGATLAVSRQREAVPIDRVLNSLDAETRRDVSRNLRSGGKTVRGRAADLQALFRRVPPLTDDADRLVSVLDEQRDQVRALVRNTGTVMQAISARGGDLQSLIRTAKTTAEAVAARDAAVRTTFESLPPTLRQARGSISTLRAFSRTATPVVDDARTSLQTLRPVLDDLAPTAVRARKLTDELPALFRAANPALDQLRTFSGDADAVVPRLENVLRQANPALNYLKPYYRDVGSLVSNFGKGLMFDKWGGIGRCLCPITDRVFTNQTPEIRAILGLLLDQDPVKSLVHAANNAYREPGSLPYTDKEYSGKYPRVEAEAGGPRADP